MGMIKGLNALIIEYILFCDEELQFVPLSRANSGK